MHSVLKLFRFGSLTLWRSFVSFGAYSSSAEVAVESWSQFTVQWTHLSPSEVRTNNFCMLVLELVRFLLTLGAGWVHVGLCPSKKKLVCSAWGQTLVQVKWYAYDPRDTRDRIGFGSRASESSFKSTSVVDDD